MTHQHSSVIIYETSDYNRFRMISGNRGLNDMKIKRIIKEIESGNDVLKYYPIQVKSVGNMLEILDGQHRYFISQKLSRPVYYIIIEEQKTMADIAKINSNVDKWNAQNFIDCYLLNGDDNYQQLKNFINDYGFSVSVSLQLLHDGDPGIEGHNAALTNDFKNGIFKVDALDKAIQLAETCKNFSSFNNWRSRAFVIAIYRIQKAALVSIDEILTAYNRKPEMLTEQARYKAYINVLEQIMNYGKKIRIVII